MLEDQIKNYRYNMFLGKFPFRNLYIEEIYEKSDLLLSLNRRGKIDGSIVCFCYRRKIGTFMNNSNPK